MDNSSLEAGIGDQGNDLKTSALVDDLEASILLAHKKYFHGNFENHDHEVLYDCVIKYFAGMSKNV